MDIFTLLAALPGKRSRLYNWREKGKEKAKKKKSYYFKSGQFL